MGTPGAAAHSCRVCRSLLATCQPLALSQPWSQAWPGGHWSFVLERPVGTKLASAGDTGCLPLMCGSVPAPPGLELGSVSLSPCGPRAWASLCLEHGR